MAPSATPKLPVARHEEQSRFLKKSVPTGLPRSTSATSLSKLGGRGTSPGINPSTHATKHTVRANGREYYNAQLDTTNLHSSAPHFDAEMPRRRPSQSSSKQGTDGEDVRSQAYSVGNASTPTLTHSSSSTPESSRPRVLRRKPSVIGRYMSQKQQKSKAQSGLHSSKSMALAESVEDVPPLSNTFEGPSYESETRTSPGEKTSMIPLETGTRLESSRPRHDDFPLSRMTPISDVSTTPSLPSTTSPGAFSHATTQTSLTSYSPLQSMSSQVGSYVRSSPTAKRSDAFHGSQSDSDNFKTRSLKSGTPKIHSDGQETVHSRYREPGSSQQGGTKFSRSTKLEGSAIPRKSQATGTVSADSLKPLRGQVPVHPPELAHLMQSSGLPDKDAGNPPPRPSRDGTIGLNGQDKPLPVVQSNLSKVEPSKSRGKGSSGSARAAQDSYNSVQSRNASFETENRPDQHGPPKGQGVPPNLPRLDTSSHARSPGKVGNTPPSASKSPCPETLKPKSRFGFFSRRSKAENMSKHSRKGPQAGTGHEGYGKHSFRGASSSSTSVHSAPARAASAGSSKQGRYHRTSSDVSIQGSDLDDFLQQRLAPVYMRGDGGSSDTYDRGSGSAFDDETPFSPITSSPRTSQTSHSSSDLPTRYREHSRTPHLATVPLAEQSEPEPFKGVEMNGFVSPQFKSPSQIPGRPVKSPDHGKLAESPSSGKGEIIQSPSTGEQSARPSISSSSPVRKISTEPDNHPTQKKSNWSFFPKASNQNKGGSKWGIFQRTRPVEATPEEATQVESRGRSLGSKTPAHYAMLESQEPVDMEDLERIMREADIACAGDRTSTTSAFEDTSETSRIGGQTSTQDKKDSDLARSISEVPSVDSHNVPEATGDIRQEESIRSETQHAVEPVPSQSRLPQVGRIPKVVSKRDRERKLPDQSFSRPFASAQPRPLLSSPKPASASPSRPREDASAISRPESKNLSLEKSAVSLFPPSSYRGPNSASPSPAPSFLDFSVRKNSDQSYSSGSGTIHYPTASYMAAPPDRLSTSSPDEVWKEYDDLIDDVLTPGSSAASPQPGKARQEYFTKNASEPAPRPSKMGRKGDTAFPRLGNPEMFSRSEEAGTTTDPTKRRVDPRPSFEVPSPITAFVAGYADSNEGSVKQARSNRESGGTNKSLRSTSVYSERSGVASLSHKRSRSFPENRASQGQSSSGERRTASQSAPENPSSALFRFRVLMTGKWLSFGRVLFSPAHNHVGGNLDDRILVVDGLGKGK